MVHGLGDEKYRTFLDVNFRSANSFSLHNLSDLPTKMELGAHMALVGCLLEEPEEPAFVAGIATVENLTQWARHTGVKMTHFFRADADADADAVSGSIELTRRDPMTAGLGDVAGDTEDKAETTRRVEWSRTGVNLGVARPDEAAIARAVDEVLAVPSYRERARALQAEIAAAPGVAGVERIVRSLVPARGRSGAGREHDTPRHGRNA